MAYPLWIKNLKKRAAALKRRKTANSKKYWIKKAIRESGYAHKINPKKITKRSYIKRTGLGSKPPSIQNAWGVTPKWIRDISIANVKVDSEGKEIIDKDAWDNLATPEIPDELRWNIPAEPKASIAPEVSWGSSVPEGSWGS